jgi:tRNA A37 methylthiotransferase MiaB
MNPRSVLPILSPVALMYTQPKVFKFIHLPIQSGSDDVLGRMRRGYTVDDFRRIMAEVRSSTPDISLSTDLIVGYPGETEEDHVLNLKAIQDFQPDIVNVTKFSSRPGTEAASSERGVAGWKVKDRSREIARLRFKVSSARNRAWVGRKVTALSTERGKNKSTIFRTDEYRQIVVPGQHRLGEFRSIVVTDATATYLRGELEDLD